MLSSGPNSKPLLVLRITISCKRVYVSHITISCPRVLYTVLFVTVSPPAPMEAQGKQKAVHIHSLLPSEESVFIDSLLSEDGVRPGNTTICEGHSANAVTCIMHRLYHRFMEDLLRKSQASKAVSDSTRLTTSDLCHAIRTNESLAFLDNVFIDTQQPK